MISHRLKIIAVTTTALTVLAAAGAAYASCTGPCPPPTNFPCTPTNFDPTNPAASGYQLVQSDNFASVGTSTIDMSNTGNPGFHWYLRQPFGGPPEPSSDFTTDANGLVITNSGAGFNITTAYPNSGAANGQQWVGTAFGNGGYFEIKMAFDGPTVAACASTCGYPTFWSMDVGHWANVGGDHWPGQAAGFTHFIEDDFFEWDTSGFAINDWGSGIWDWSGPFNGPCGSGYQLNGFCGILNDGRASANGVNTIFISNAAESITWNNTMFHTLGAVWVPGNAANSNTGYRDIFFDGAEAKTRGSHLTNKTSWADGTMTPSSLPASPEVWSIHDLDSIVVNIAGAVGVPFHVAYVNIWQIPGCGTVAH